MCLIVRASFCLFPSLTFVSLCSSLSPSELGPCQFIFILSLSRVWFFPLQAQTSCIQPLMVLFSACPLILDRRSGWIHWLLWSCLLSPSHHPKCFRPSLQHLGHTPEQSLLSPGCLPKLSHHCSHCLSSSALPVTSAQADSLSSPACFSSPVIILLATFTVSLLPVTTSGKGIGCQPGTSLSPTLTTTP